MPVPSSGGGTTYGGEIVVGFFTRYNGSGWVMRGHRSHGNYTGTNYVARPHTFQISVDGLGANAEFTLQIIGQSGQGGTAALTKVTFNTGSVVESTGTPGSVLVPFIALGGA